MALLNEQAGGFASNEVKIKAIDISSAMTRKARKLIAEHYPEHNIEIITEDVCEVDMEPCDMIIINLTLQFLPVEKRLSLLQRCHQALAEGGVLILPEKTHWINEQDDAWRVERYYDFKRSMTRFQFLNFYSLVAFK